ncbi:hypothetical protein [Marinobacter changyiensis]|uniref:ATP-dependent DNA ligase n=1 Tax=Marinobacter changyiensis TaxID=2604091 RepID=UPI003CCD015F
MLAKFSDGKVTLLTRNAKDRTRLFPAIRDALEKLPVRNAVIDGELVGPQLDGSTDHVQRQGADFFREVCQLGLEGVVSKRSDAHYQNGRRSTWIKTKCTRQEEFVVGGFTRASGRRQGFGSLLLGAYDDDQLVYAGESGPGSVAGNSPRCIRP